MRAESVDFAHRLQKLPLERLGGVVDIRVRGLMLARVENVAAGFFDVVQEAER
ncbi:hypothetical protein ALP05_200052 [Pseudomonas caricapapayae]|uniref:Uncharacterized protein n=1 Tax=Pseudomonas caricapapayae TaxID=46678 RepID=A0A3M6F3Z5_9PSED|nr:hypothetical protein ALP05_200052 [Pseudomonas caricapapayae]